MDTYDICNILVANRGIMREDKAVKAFKAAANGH